MEKHLKRIEKRYRPRCFEGHFPQFKVVQAGEIQEFNKVISEYRSLTCARVPLVRHHNDVLTEVSTELHTFLAKIIGGWVRY